MIIEKKKHHRTFILHGKRIFGPLISLTRQRQGNGYNRYRAWNLRACLHLAFVLFRVFQRCNLIDKYDFIFLVIVISFLM